LTTLLCVAAALSAALLIATCFCRRWSKRSATGRSPVRLAMLLLYLVVATVTTGGLLWLEQLPRTAVG
jgi:hypothetical protein